MCVCVFEGMFLGEVLPENHKSKKPPTCWSPRGKTSWLPAIVACLEALGSEQLLMSKWPLLLEAAGSTLTRLARRRSFKSCQGKKHVLVHGKKAAAHKPKSPQQIFDLSS